MEKYEELEREWGAFVGNPRVVACSSGTAALHLALEALRLPAGSKVIVPDYAMVACARAVTMAGLRPVFVDVTELGLIDPDAVVRELPLDWRYNREVSAVMAVHTYGRRCDMPALIDVAARYNLKVIEDLAEAHLTPPHPCTDAACWSFYKNKVVFGEEGGAVAFRYTRTAEETLARQLRSLGFTEDHDYTHLPRGHNYRMSNLHAAEVLSNFAHLKTWAEVRRSQVKQYDAVMPDRWRRPERETPWVYDLRIPGLTAEEQRLIVSRLRSAGVQARYGFKPLRMQPEYVVAHRGTETTADVLAREVIYLPLGQTMHWCDPATCRRIIEEVTGPDRAS